MATKAQEAERLEAVERLREWVKPGDEVYTVLRHVSRSGMFRVIDVVGIGEGGPGSESRRIYSFGWNVAKALGYGYDRDREGVRVSGCGMDMGFHLVYELGAVLFPDGFECIGDGMERDEAGEFTGRYIAARCPSNDHSNGDRDYSPHHHGSGGYALRHRWL